MSANILTYISLGVSVIAIVLGTYAIIASGNSRAFRKFFSSVNKPEDLDDIVKQIIEKINQLDGHANQTNSAIAQIVTQLNTATQHVGIIRYNSNGDDGGNLSFSAAFLDAHQSGIVLTSLHGRQNNRIYAKLITQGVSESTLSEEEREALINAITAHATAPEATSKSKNKLPKNN